MHSRIRYIRLAVGFWKTWSTPPIPITTQQLKPNYSSALNTRKHHEGNRSRPSWCVNIGVDERETVSYMVIGRGFSVLLLLRFNFLESRQLFLLIMVWGRQSPDSELIFFYTPVSSVFVCAPSFPAGQCGNQVRSGDKSWGNRCTGTDLLILSRLSAFTGVAFLLILSIVKLAWSN